MSQAEFMRGYGFFSQSHVFALDRSSTVCYGMTMQKKIVTVSLSVETHKAIVDACPDGHRMRLFHEKLVKAGLEALKKRKKK